MGIESNKNRYRLCKIFGGEVRESAVIDGPDLEGTEMTKDAVFLQGTK
jgi:hypothetical protein